MHHLLYPPFQGPTNTIHLVESDKAIQVWRLSAKLETSYRAEALPCKCRTLTRQVNTLLAILSTKSTDLFGEITYYMMVIVEVVMSCEGLKYNTKGRMIQMSHSITYTAGNVQPVFV